MSSDRIMSTEAIRTIAASTKANGLNRQLTEDDLRDLDPTGWHIGSMMLFGHNMDNTSLPLHHRICLFLKVSDTMAPRTAIVDITNDLWEKMPLVSEWMKVVASLNGDVDTSEAADRDDDDEVEVSSTPAEVLDEDEEANEIITGRPHRH